MLLQNIESSSIIHDNVTLDFLKVYYYRVWGNPWSYMQPTTEVNGTLIGYHRKMDRRWWLAQVDHGILLDF